MEFPREDFFSKVTLRSQPCYQAHQPILSALASFDARDSANERDWFSHLAQFIFQTCPSLLLLSDLFLAHWKQKGTDCFRNSEKYMSGE